MRRSPARSRIWPSCWRCAWSIRSRCAAPRLTCFRCGRASGVRSVANSGTRSAAVRDSLDRIAAMTARYGYLLRSSWMRLAEVIYWPAMQMLVWGFLYTYLYTSDSKIANTAGPLLGAVLLCDVLFRGQLGFTFTCLEEGGAL